MSRSRQKLLPRKMQTAGPMGNANQGLLSLRAIILGVRQLLQTKMQTQTRKQKLLFLQAVTLGGVLLLMSA